MTLYHSLYVSLELPQSVLEIASGKIELPMYAQVPYECYGFPPALVPLWSTDSPDYTGVWKHWFVPRTMTFVTMSVEAGRQTSEVARNFDQLVREITLYGMMAQGGLTPEVQAFASAMHVDNVQAVYNAFTKSGSKISGLLSLPEFQNETPLACLPSELGYSGEYPTKAMPLTPDNVRRVCTLEVNSALRQLIILSPFAPAWFTTSDQRPVFDSLLSANDFEGAWMSLNSTGWDFADAKRAIRRLRDVANLPGFDLLVDAWTAEPHEGAGSY